MTISEKCLVAGIAISALSLLYSIYKDIKNAKIIMDNQNQILDNQALLQENINKAPGI